jgi:hypothetical protein
MRPDQDLTERLFVRASEDADASRRAVAREEKVVCLVDEYAGDAGEAGQRTQVCTRAAVEHVDTDRPCVRDVHPTAREVDVRVIEARLVAPGHWHEADADEAQDALTDATSVLHHA